MGTTPTNLNRGGVVVLAACAGLLMGQTETPVTEPSEIDGRPVEIRDTQIYQFDTHTVTYHRIRPPVLKEPAMVQPQPSPPPVRLEDLSPEERERAEKPYYAPHLEVRVVDGITEIRWRDGDERYTVWTSLDGNHLCALSAVETGRMFFTFFGSISNETAAEVRQWNEDITRYNGPADARKTIPRLRLADGGESVYVFAEKPATGVSKLARVFVEDLHAYYDAHRDAIARRYEEQEADRLAREKELRDNPPQPPDVVIEYFVIPNDTRQAGGAQ